MHAREDACGQGFGKSVYTDIRKKGFVMEKELLTKEEELVTGGKEDSGTELSELAEDLADPAEHEEPFLLMCHSQEKVAREYLEFCKRTRLINR
jgi:hypothetical protein